MNDAYINLKQQIEACQLCAASLPLGPRPVLRFSPTARLLIIGQAPGTRVHASGIPWDDPSGERLRQWLGIDDQVFYDEAQVAIMPMGFCYPGRGRSGDAPPRPECGPQWHQRVLGQMPDVRLTLLIGQYAQRYYLREKSGTLTQTVRDWRRFLPHTLPLPHPSPRNRFWLQQNPWFEQEVLPQLRRRVHDCLR